ncbi:hypothetical protein EAO75_25700 [Streptomyces sp. uw30]|uniref:hypothetical protein n=1 Tax=Streptomyces sp. uw30 TaxID=1828179 RepID=UPI0011CDD261|nr:hypothetical protein [Streptomyces sp. uw30]TXS46148.1 hypothetical protein EAO75_25700 [Streptomyces sp. uw30]
MDPVTAVAAAGVALVVKGALESAGQEAGRSGWAGGARLVERIRARFRGNAAAEQALEQVTGSPDDENAQQDLQRQLAGHMMLDSDFEAEIRKLVDEAVAAQGRSGPQISAGLIKNAQVFNGKVEVQGNWTTS